VRRTEDGERLAAAQPDRLVPVLLDVTSPEQIRGAVETITGLVGERGLDGLVNNAGIAIGGPLEFVSAESLRQQFAVNVIGLHAVTTAFLPLIRRARRVGGPGVGRIVHVGSVSGRIAQPFIGPYSASKHAVEALADALRVELAPEGIHVAVIEPGQVRTPIWEKGLASSAGMLDSIPAEGRERYGLRIRVFRWILERAPSRGCRLRGWLRRSVTRSWLPSHERVTCSASTPGSGCCCVVGFRTGSWTLWCSPRSGGWNGGFGEAPIRRRPGACSPLRLPGPVSGFSGR